MRRRQLHRILLSSNERQIFRLLQDVVDHYGLRTNLRVAGGWVRNKMLGKAAGDIDIALDNITGSAFVHHLQRFRVDVLGEKERSVGLMRANPAQSKHLETATTEVLGAAVDFAHLRSEDYAAHSRIPTNVQFGSPAADASRRDFTVNSLFYSLGDGGTVEDWTGRGVRDLEDGVLRTPLRAAETLSDDPLRALRALRFAATFSFALAPALTDALASPLLAEELQRKVSRERVGIEVHKMLSLGGGRPLRALALLREASLVDTVLPLAPRSGSAACEHGEQLAWSSEQWVVAFAQAQHVAAARAAAPSTTIGAGPSVMVFAALLSAALPAVQPPVLQSSTDAGAAAQACALPEGNASSLQGSLEYAARLAETHAEALASARHAAQHTLLGGLGLRKRDATSVSRIMAASQLLPPLPRRAIVKGGDARGVQLCRATLEHCLRFEPSDRVRFGLWLHHAGDIWASSLTVAAASAAATAASASAVATDDDDVATAAAAPRCDMQHEPMAWHGSVTTLKCALLRSGLLEAAVPWLTGHDVMERAGIPRGRDVGAVLDCLRVWQLAHPCASVTDASAFVEHGSLVLAKAR